MNIDVKMTPVQGGTHVTANVVAQFASNSLVDGIIFRSVMQRIVDRWPAGDLKPHFPDIIASMNGWNPLVVGETMSVGFGDGRYEIKRTK